MLQRYDYSFIVLISFADKTTFAPVISATLSFTISSCFGKRLTSITSLSCDNSYSYQITTAVPLVATMSIEPLAPMVS